MRGKLISALFLSLFSFILLLTAAPSHADGAEYSVQVVQIIPADTPTAREDLETPTIKSNNTPPVFVYIDFTQNAAHYWNAAHTLQSLWSNFGLTFRLIPNVTVIESDKSCRDFIEKSGTTNPGALARDTYLNASKNPAETLALIFLECGGSKNQSPQIVGTGEASDQKTIVLNKIITSNVALANGTRKNLDAIGLIGQGLANALGVPNPKASEQLCATAANRKLHGPLCSVGIWPDAAMWSGYADLLKKKSCDWFVECSKNGAKADHADVSVLKSVGSLKCVTLQGTGSGFLLKNENCDENEFQMFRSVPKGFGFMLVNLRTGLCLGLDGKATNKDTLMKAANCWGAHENTFYRAGDQFKLVGTQLCLSFRDTFKEQTDVIIAANCFAGPDTSYRFSGSLPAYADLQTGKDEGRKPLNARPIFSIPHPARVHLTNWDGACFGKDAGAKNLTTRPCANLETQQFDISPVNKPGRLDPGFVIKSIRDERCLDVPASSRIEGEPLITYGCTATDNQTMHLSRFLDANGQTSQNPLPLFEGDLPSPLGRSIQMTHSDYCLGSAKGGAGGQVLAQVNCAYPLVRFTSAALAEGWQGKLMHLASGKCIKMVHLFHVNFEATLASCDDNTLEWMRTPRLAEDRTFHLSFENTGKNAPTYLGNELCISKNTIMDTFKFSAVVCNNDGRDNPDNFWSNVKMTWDGDALRFDGKHCLTVPYGITAPGMLIDLLPCVGGDTQAFRFVSVSLKPE